MQLSLPFTLCHAKTMKVHMISTAQEVGLKLRHLSIAATETYLDWMVTP